MKQYCMEKSAGGKISKGYITDKKPHFQSVSGCNNNGFSRGRWDSVTPTTGWFAPMSHRFSSHSVSGNSRDRSRAPLSTIPSCHWRSREWKLEGRSISHHTVRYDSCRPTQGTLLGLESEKQRFRERGTHSVDQPFRVSWFQREWRENSPDQGWYVERSHEPPTSSTCFPLGPHVSDQPWRTLLCWGSFQAQRSKSDSHTPKKVGLLSAMWNSHISYILRLSSSTSHPFFHPRGSAPHSTDCKCLLYTHTQTNKCFPHYLVSIPWWGWEMEVQS